MHPKHGTINFNVYVGQLSQKNTLHVNPLTDLVANSSASHVHTTFVSKANESDVFASVSFGNCTLLFIIMFMP